MTAAHRHTGFSTGTVLKILYEGFHGAKVRERTRLKTIKNGVLTFVAALTFGPAVAYADAAAEMAAKLQNPLANIKAIMTDNSVGFDTGNTNGTSVGYQIQPVYAIDFADRGFTLIPRAVIPIVNVEPV